MSAKAGPPILLASADATLRRHYVPRLEEWAPVRVAAPGALPGAADLVDALGAVVCLGRTPAPPQALEVLQPVLRLPCAARTLLIWDGLADDALERALAVVRPSQLLAHPVPGPALHFALERVRSRFRGRGARDQHRPSHALLGVSGAIRELIDEIRQVAPSKVAVLVLGETGTGKELVARALHDQGPRADGPFVAVNCGALPESLLEAELFGFRKGSFTGAERDRAGLFEEADGGTVFLDEIGDTTPALQVKLLRAIEEGEVRPLGGGAPRHVDVRVVSATNRDLESAVEEGSFRQDLYYRLNGVRLTVPPLRRRRVDIPFLAQHFAEELGEANARRIVLSEDFLEAIARHDFPGNVRELRNTVERAITMAAPAELVSQQHLSGLPTHRELLEVGTLRDRLAHVEIQAIREALEQFDGNRSRAAEALGLSRVGLRQKMRRLGLESLKAR